MAQRLAEDLDVVGQHVVAVDLSEDKSGVFTAFPTGIIPILFTFHYEEAHFHGGEVSNAVELKHDFHITAREALVAPAHIVVAWPSFVDVAACKIIQAEDSIGQLTQALGHAGKQKEKRR